MQNEDNYVAAGLDLLQMLEYANERSNTDDYGGAETVLIYKITDDPYFYVSTIDQFARAATATKEGLKILAKLNPPKATFKVMKDRLPEKDIIDAPVYYGGDEASAWTCGWNAAREAVGL